MKLVFLANQFISWESSKEIYGQKLKNHKGDSDLFPLGQSTAESRSKCGVTFRYLKKAHERDQTIIIKEKEYRDIKMHAFQWKSIKNDCHKFIYIINVKLASWMRNVNGLYTRRLSCCANVKIPLKET